MTTTGGLMFYSGTDWRPALAPGSDPGELSGVARIGAARWLITAGGGRLLEYSQSGLTELARAPDQSLTLESASGTLGDLIVVAARGPNGPVLLTLSSVGWLEPHPVTELSIVNAIARCGPAKWLIAGRGHDGAGCVAIYYPLEGRLRRIEASGVRAYVAASGELERGVGIAVGTDGACCIYDDGNVRAERVEGGAHLSAAAVDVGGGFWASGAGQLFYRGPAGSAPWRRVWHAEGWAPVVSMFADSGELIAVTSDGAVLEGQR